MAESLLCSPETIMTQFSNWLYPNIKAKIKKKEKKNYIKRKKKLPSCVMGKMPTFSESHFPHLQNVDSIYHKGYVCYINRINIW